MIDRILETLVVQSPGVASAIIIVVLFLKHLKDSDKARTEMLHDIGAECHEVQGRCIVSLDKNTEMLGRTAGVLEQVERELQRRS